MNKDFSEENVLNNITEEDKKAKGKYILICLLSGVIGGIFGFFTLFGIIYIDAKGLSFLEIWSSIQLSSVFYFRILLLVSGAVLLLISYLFYHSARKMWNVKEKREDNWDVIDHKLEMSIVFSNILSVSQTSLFALACYMLSRTIHTSALLLLITLVAYLLYIFLGISISRKTVNMTKEMNPQLKGSIYDTKFQDTWYKSCDEAQRMQIGIACFKAYKVTNYCCMALIIIFAIAGMAFEIGMLPVICVTVVWITLVSVYMYYSIKAKNLLKANTET